MLHLDHVTIIRPIRMDSCWPLSPAAEHSSRERCRLITSLLFSTQTSWWN